jgi:hypothetical protein
MAIIERKELSSPLPDQSAVETKEVAELRKALAIANARLSAFDGQPQPANYQLFKNAAVDSGVAKTTLRRRCEAGLVACYQDEAGLWVDVTDASRVRFEQARTGVARSRMDSKPRAS